MRTAVYFQRTAMFLLLCAHPGVATPLDSNSKNLKYEEYIIEHEISSGQAKNAALAITFKSMLPPPGCHDCTPEEIKYCLGSDLINDHCCCDLRYHELLPFIPHTCYVGTKLCQPVVSNCDEYRRLHSCCCQKHAYLKWVANKSDGETLTTFMALFITTLAVIVNNLC